MMIKSSKTIEKLERASKLADDCFDYICKKIKIGMTEKKVASLMDKYMLSHGATALSFETIVGSGVNSSQIHSIPSNRVIEYGDIVQLDFGCVVDGYCSDTSRVLFMGKILPKYKKVYNIVKKAQLEGIKRIKPGMTADKADAICRNIIKKEGYLFNHAVGHGVGKKVHEKPVISPKNKVDVLKDNVVFTIEPGIYIEGKFGVRIEDTCVLKDGKVIPLNKTSKEITIIEC